ncbi:hypothetical protein ALC56_11683, partial [Trachymyrmex septentrionalis]
ILVCFSCLRFEHISSDCKSVARCAKCGQNRYSKLEECARHQLPPRCCNCGQEHFPSQTLCCVPFCYYL